MIAEALHLSALVPGVAALIARKREFALVALAFFMSAIGDAGAAVLGGSWAATFLWLPVQLALVFAYLLSAKPLQWALVALCVVTAASAYLSGLGPEFAVTMAGSCVILWFNRGVLYWPILIYFGFGTIAFSAWIASGFAPALWVAYQACRIGAYAAFVWACFKTEEA